MEVIPNAIPTYLPENGDTNDRSACLQIIQLNSKMFCLETRPTQFTKKFLCIFPAFVKSESTMQNSKGESQYNNIDNSSMANSTLVFTSFFNVIFPTFSNPNISRRSEEP